MAFLFLRRLNSVSSLSSCRFLSGVCHFMSKESVIVDKVNPITMETSAVKAYAHNTLAYYSTKFHLSSFFKDDGSCEPYDIELVDNDTWQVSSGLAQAWRALDEGRATKGVSESVDDQFDEVASLRDFDPDFEEIDNMRIRGNLFYKLDRSSKEFEEYSFDFHRRKSSTSREDQNGNQEMGSFPKKDNKKKENRGRDLKCSEVHKLPQILKDEKVYTLVNSLSDYDMVKKKRPRASFNQLTGPYHEPFCLDIYISKASVRACIIHRVTSKVVAVAHSISKDMKFDLSSTKNAVACVAVGKVLAQRALADDIHDAVYTPRKGEILEGKLKIVLQSIIDSGINVKVKLKQKTPRKAGLLLTT
ncbi:hypothetical protein K2173_008764 [Erythroxylum novogranatense]|uniref:Uncharacterized protein n=1 Tax=Erythroxylum novogranatense TaxID=1862640 RepID=A0AAV8S5W2_9ROSI|nr:hypothetical protein K2173_008764 [Erythroxylum novogranatense]